MDETYFLYSEKGSRCIVGRKPRTLGGNSHFRGISREQVCVLVARDRTKNTFSLSFDSDNRSVRKFAVESCLYPTQEINETIRLRKVLL